MSSETIAVLLPEIVLAVAAVAIFLGGAFFGPSDRRWSVAALAALVAAAVALAWQVPSADLSGPLQRDFFALHARWLALAVGGLLVLLASRSAAGDLAAEYHGALLLTVAGLMLVGSADELVLLFLGLELVSIPTYVLLYVGKRGESAQEAAAKYFFLSVMASALLLYGFSFLYGIAGSTRLEQLALRAAEESGPARHTLAALATVFVLGGLGFRMAAVPFHFYAPDVYQGTSNANAAFLSVIPKLTGVVALVRLGEALWPALDAAGGLGWRLAAALAVLTMTLGNVLALWQDNFRRLMAYSSIAHAGYLLLGIAVWLAVPAESGTQTTFDGLTATVLYLWVYSLATLGTMAAVVYLGRRSAEIEGVDELAGLAKTYPRTAAALAVFMFSLTGIPFAAGFVGKFMLFSSALGVDAAAAPIAGSLAAAGMRPWFIGLAVVGVLNAAVSAGYYLRIVGLMYFRPSLGRPAGEGGWLPAAAFAVCAAAVLGLGLYPGPLLNAAHRAAQSARAARVVPREEPPAQTAAPVVSRRPHF